MFALHQALKIFETLNEKGASYTVSFNSTVALTRAIAGTLLVHGGKARTKKERGAGQARPENAPLFCPLYIFPSFVPLSHPF